MTAYNPVKGGAIPQFYLSNSVSSWVDGYFLGLGSAGPKASTADVVAWLAPAAGILTNLTIIGQAPNIGGSALTVSVCKNASSTAPTYPATLLYATIPTGASAGQSSPAANTTTARGDMIVVKLSGGTWNAGGISISALWTPT